MKKIVSFALCFSAIAIWSCNDSGSSGSGSDTSSAAISNDTATTTSDANNNTAAASTPLSKDDSMFVMDAAVSGMVEVESGNVAQQNAANQRVKDYGGMMVTDHSKANSELKSLASSHGIMLPDSLPADKRKHVQDMSKMTGKAFDKHYIGMMVTDHGKVLAKFKKASESAQDASLKTWAAQTLPTLQKHLDSAQAIKKGM